MQQRDGSFLAHALAAGYVVGAVAHQSEQVDNLVLVVDSVFGAHLGDAHLLEAAVMARTVHVYMFVDELTVVFVGCCHQHFEALLLCLARHGAYDVVCLEAFDLEDTDVHGFENLLYPWHCGTYVFGSLLSLSLIALVCFVAESLAFGVESYSQMSGVDFRE